MANIAVGNVHVSAPLTDFALGYHPQGFVAEQVASVTPVAHENDDYYIWDQPSAFRVLRSDGTGSLRADGAESLEENYSFTLAQYKCEAYALKTRVTKRQEKNADSVLNLQMSKTRRVQDKLLIDMELRVASLVTNASNYASSNKVTNSGATQYNNGSFVSQPSNEESAIIAQLLAGKEAIRKATGGYEPNCILLPPPVELVMINDPGLRQLMQYTHNNLVETGTPFTSQLLGMNIIRPKGMYTTSVEGAASVTYNDVWGKNIVMFYRDPSPGTDGLTFLNIFRSQDWQVKSWYKDETQSTYFEPEIVQDEVGVSFLCSYLIQNAVA